MIKFLLFFEFNLSMSSVLFFIRPVLDIFYFLLAFSNCIYYTVYCRKVTFYNPLLIIYTPLKRPMAPPSVFYFFIIPLFCVHNLFIYHLKIFHLLITLSSLMYHILESSKGTKEKSKKDAKKLFE